MARRPRLDIEEMNLRLIFVFWTILSLLEAHGLLNGAYRIPNQAGPVARCGESFPGATQLVPVKYFWIQNLMDEIFVRVTWFETRGAFAKCHTVYCSV